MNPPPALPPSKLHAQLRAATATRHRSLEAALDLLRAPPDRDTFRQLLVRFHGFHQTWEPAIAVRLPSVVLPMPRLPLIEHDLRALGVGGMDASVIPACRRAALLGNAPATALGSVYVLEGSTLGGRLITRHARQAAWYPAQGLRYFDPYGDDTAARWRRTLAHLEAARADADAVVEGAVRTFEILHEWLVPAVGARPPPRA